jgi:hypothetical protein
MERLPQPTGECEAATTGAIARIGGGIAACDEQTNVSLADACQSTLCLPCTTAADYSGDLDYSDDEAIGDWVWKSSQTAKLIADNVGSCDGGVKRGVGTEAS